MQHKTRKTGSSPSDLVKYKYFLIHDRNKKVIYAECIEWLFSEFDRTDNPEISIMLKKSFGVKVLTTEERIDCIDEEAQTVTFNDEFILKYTEQYSEFISQRFDEEIFNPLIDRCSHIEMFINDEADTIIKDYSNWTKENQSLLEEINSRFDLDFLKQPELINTFTFYKPTRILVDSYFTDKPNHGENRLPTKLKVTFFDEFDLYDSAKYTITSYIEGNKNFLSEGIVSDGEKDIEFEVSPDELEIEIIEGDSVIYNSRYGFIRNIQVNIEAQGGSVVLDKGVSVSKYSKSSFNIGMD